MADIFLSYARSERGRAEQIKVLLERMGLSVFFDVEGLDGGDVFPDVLDHEVKTAGAVISLWSPHSLSRPWIKIECRIAKDRGVLIPVSIAPINPLSDVPAAFYDVQHIDLVDFDGDPENLEWRKVVRSIARTLKRPELVSAAGVSAARPERHTPQGRKRSGGLAMVGIAAAVLVVAAGIGLAVWRPWERTTPPVATPAQTALTAPNSGSVASPATTPSTAASTTSTLGPEDLAQLRKELATINFSDPALNGKAAVEKVLQRRPLSVLESAAEGGEPAAAALMAIAHMQGQYAAADAARAFKYFETACKGGIQGSCNSLGFMYANGQGVTRDDAKAKDLYDGACKAGDAWGCFNLGLMYASARGVPLDGAKACDGALLASCTSLGLLHYNAVGGPVDFPAARKLFDKACTGGEWLACSNLGFMYASGQSVDVDNAKAVDLYRKSCDGGYFGGCSYLGYHLVLGLGVDKDVAKGRSLLQRSCNARDAGACNLLAGLPQQ